MNELLLVRRTGLIALVLLALTLPFELELGWIQAGPITLTNVQFILGLVILLALITRHGMQRAARIIPASWLVLGVFYIVALFLSSLFAPEFHVNALKASLRTLSGLALALAVPQIIRTQRDFLWIVGALVAGAFLAVAIGLIEMIHGQAFAWLEPFRPFPTMAGPFMRLTGPFDYANQTAMFVEASLPLLLGLAWSTYHAHRYRLAGLLIVATLLCLQGTFLTYSRSSFATILLASLMVAVVLWSANSLAHKRQSVLWAGTTVAVIVLILANAAFSPAFRLRLATEGDQEWYRAQLQVPAEFRVRAEETIRVPVTVINKGALTWSSTGAKPVFLAARWIHQSTNREWTEHSRWPLALEVKPTETVRMVVPLQAPKKGGDYELRWDLLQEDVLWFGAKSGVRTSSQVTVVEDATTGTSETEREESARWVAAHDFATPIPNRGALWQIALQQVREHPLLGIGLDNFRLTYGRELGYSHWNTTIHTNNWYLETLVSLGIAGSLPFFIWLALLGLDILQTLRESWANIWLAAIAVGLLAYVIHGLLDYFLLFNATGLLFWMLVGLWLSQKSIMSSGGAPWQSE